MRPASRSPVRPLSQPPRIVRWRAIVLFVRGVLWLCVVGSVALAAFLAPRAYTNRAAAERLAQGGALGTARVVGVTDEAPRMTFTYTADGTPRERTVDITDRAADTWGPAVAEARSNRETRARFPNLPLAGFRMTTPIAVRVPAGEPNAGEPRVDGDPGAVLSIPAGNGLVEGLVEAVTLRHRFSTLAIDGTSPVRSFTEPRYSGAGPELGMTFDIVYEEGDLGRRTMGPPGTLFPTPVQRYGWPVGVGFVLLAATVWPYEAMLRRRRRKLESFIERSARLLEVDVDTGQRVLYGLLSIAAVVAAAAGRGGTGSMGGPPLRRRFSLRIAEEERKLTRSVAASYPISTKVGDPVSVLCDPDDPWNVVFLEELLAWMKVKG